MKSLNVVFIAKLLAACGLMTTLVACQGDSSPRITSQTPAPTQKQAPNPAAPQSFVSAENGISIKIQKKTALRLDRANLDEFKKNLNVYLAEIQIPEDVFIGDVRLIRSFNATALNPQYEHISKSNAVYENGMYHLTESLSLWEKDLTPKQVTYKIITQDETLAEASFDLLPDYLVANAEDQNAQESSLRVLSGEYHFGVIFFERGAVLTTEGASLVLHAQRLYADDAKIQSFTEEQAKALPSEGQAGRSGGRIVIRAASAAGGLKFEMRGTAGGRGYVAGPQTQVKGVSPQGAPGVVGHFCEAPVLKTKNGVWSLQSRSLGRCSYECVRHPGDGLPGENGFDGLPGGRGSRGGASGFVEVDVDKQDPEFHAEVAHLPGQGGPGGAGSAGTAGGEGGLPGDDLGICRKARKGPTGAQGLPGATGPAGSAGDIEVSQLVISGQKIF